MHALPLGVAAERSVHYFWDYFGASEVCALPLGIVAERSVHYFGIIGTSEVCALPLGVAVERSDFAKKCQKILIMMMGGRANGQVCADVEHNK